MVQINNWQIFCILLNITATIGFVIYPNTLALSSGNNSWLAVLTAMIPCTLLIYLYLFILKKSPRPFPKMLEDCFGQIAGKILGVFYSAAFFISAAITLRVFINFVESNILPGVPISVFTGGLILVAYYTITKGLQGVTRMLELEVIVVASFAIIILLLGLTTKPDINYLLPLGQISVKGFAISVFNAFFILGYMIVILTLAYHSNAREHVGKSLFANMFAHTFFITAACLLTLAQFGSYHSRILAYPTFILVRRISIADFLQNIDAIFVAFWTLGIYATLCFLWYISCYVLQQALDLRDLRIVATPGAVTMGIISVMLAPNTIELRFIYTVIFPWFHSFFFIVIPAVMALILAFKPTPANGSGLSTPVENS
jgi:spore germination protein KB